MPPSSESKITTTPTTLLEVLMRSAYSRSNKDFANASFASGPVTVAFASPAQGNVFEQVLISRVHAGDAEAFYQLVRPYERAVFLAAVAIVKNDADAEEVAQEAILKAFKALGRFRQEAKFST